MQAMHIGLLIKIISNIISTHVWFINVLPDDIVHIVPEQVDMFE